jgi:hypothetical protein
LSSEDLCFLTNEILPSGGAVGGVGGGGCLWVGAVTLGATDALLGARGVGLRPLGIQGSAGQVKGARDYYARGNLNGHFLSGFRGAAHGASGLGFFDEPNPFPFPPSPPPPSPMNGYRTYTNRTCCFKFEGGVCYF